MRAYIGTVSLVFLLWNNLKSSLFIYVFFQQLCLFVVLFLIS